MTPEVQAALQKRTKKPKDPMQSYYIYGGGACAVFAGLLVLLVWDPSAPKEVAPETRKITDIHVNDEMTIENVEKEVSWKAEASPFFEGYTLKSVKGLFGGSIDFEKSIRSCPAIKVPLTSAFDARQKWPECFKAPVQNQGKCGSATALAAAKSMATRFCIANPEEHKALSLSPMPLVACQEGKKGCEGVNLHVPFEHLKETGLPTSKCFPYEANDEADCTACTEEPTKAGDFCQLDSVGKVMAEVTLNGPVVAMMRVTKDIFLYKSGVYKTTKATSQQLTERSKKGRRNLMQAVTIVGWGVEEGTPYWIVENTWGPEWGEKGFAKIHRANDDSSLIIEGHVIAGLVEELPKIQQKTKDDEELDALDDDDDDDDDAAKDDKEDDADLDDLDQEEA